MKVFLSAYSCQPGKGSEDGVGWHWAKNISEIGHEVWVVTRCQNRASIEVEMARQPSANLHFIYYDLPQKFHWAGWKKYIWRFDIAENLSWAIWNQAYYFFWQRNIARIAADSHKTVQFDIAHHITYASATRAVFLGNTDIPFVIGPCGGGERAPVRLRARLTRYEKLTELIRDVSISISGLSPYVRAMYKKAKIIFVSTEQSKQVVSKKYKGKVHIKLQIGIEPFIDSSVNLNNSKRENKKLLYVGRFIYWKGMDSGLRAFAMHIKTYPNTILTMVGKGKAERGWRALAQELEIEDNIQWISWVDQEQLKNIYQDHDAFLFPSFHDSGGNAVIEAMSYGLPVICLSLGGPAVSVTKKCGRIIDIRKKDIASVEAALCNAMEWVLSDNERLRQLKNEAIIRASSFSWNTIVRETYSLIEKTLKN